MAKCYFHSDKEAVEKCVTCGKQMCESCTPRYANEKVVCPLCAKEANRKERNSYGWITALISTGIVLAVAVLVVLGLLIAKDGKENLFRNVGFGIAVVAVLGFAIFMLIKTIESLKYYNARYKLALNHKEVPTTTGAEEKKVEVKATTTAKTASKAKATKKATTTATSAKKPTTAKAQTKTAAKPATKTADVKVTPLATTKAVKTTAPKAASTAKKPAAPAKPATTTADKKLAAAKKPATPAKKATTTAKKEAKPVEKKATTTAKKTTTAKTAAVKKATAKK